MKTNNAFNFPVLFRLLIRRKSSSDVYEMTAIFNLINGRNVFYFLLSVLRMSFFLLYRLFMC